jgi:peptidoglycan/xylan/chitin deacetylase (PgdA/CDA1 family)
MWTVIGLDWKMEAEAIAGRIGRGACNGAILCLHDGRELQPAPDIRETVEAVRRIVPALLARGFQLVTLSNLLCPTI